MPYNTIKIDMNKLLAVHFFWVKAGEHYGLGSKIELGSFSDPDGKVDCSGYVRELIHHATKVLGEAVDIGDGSWNQEQYLKAHAFKESTVDACYRSDDVLRIAFLDAEHGGGTRHVALVYNGCTIESHGGVGPDRQKWGSRDWMKHAKVYCLTLPAGSN